MRTLLFLLFIANICFGSDSEDQVLTYSRYYTKTCIAPIENSTIVWPRVVNGKDDDKASLFVGYSNLETSYGDEGVNIKADTPKCSKTVFFTGGPDSIGPSIPTVDVNEYNHLYGDFRCLKEQFPYLINSSFFDYIFVGQDTSWYFSKTSIITNFCSMLKEGGKMIIAIHRSNAMFAPHFNDFIDESKFSLCVYFNDLTYESYCKALGYVSDKNNITHDCLRQIDRRRQTSVLRKELDNDVPFASNFFDQNSQSYNHTIIISITKK